MPQIIQAGKLKIVVCKNCESTLSYHVNEVKSDHKTDYLGDRSDYNYIDCPECRNQVLVK